MGQFWLQMQWECERATKCACCRYPLCHEEGVAIPIFEFKDDFPWLRLARKNSVYLVCQFQARGRYCGEQRVRGAAFCSLHCPIQPGQCGSRRTTSGLPCRRPAPPGKHCRMHRGARDRCDRVVCTRSRGPPTPFHATVQTCGYPLGRSQGGEPCPRPVIEGTKRYHRHRSKQMHRGPAWLDQCGSAPAELEASRRLSELLDRYDLQDVAPMGDSSAISSDCVSPTARSAVYDEVVPKVDAQQPLATPSDRDLPMAEAHVLGESVLEENDIDREEGSDVDVVVDVSTDVAHLGDYLLEVSPAAMGLGDTDGESSDDEAWFPPGDDTELH